MTKQAMTKKTLILTGASRGIGHATAKLFESNEWRVITCSRRAFSDDCPWASGPDHHVQIDLGDPDSRATGLEQMRQILDGEPLHALVNNAGISPKGEDGERLNTINMPMDAWNRVFQVNFYAPILLARGLVEELTRGQGSIVNVTSIAGSRVHPYAGSAYSTSKAALSALTREMSADFGPLGIRVNAIAPGEIDTSILSPGTEDMVKSFPLRRLGSPKEVANTIWYLCNDQSSYVTGAELHINGGQHI